MALINCPECGKEISDSAKNCQNCGYPLRKGNDRKILIGLIALFTIASAVVFITKFFFIKDNKISTIENQNTSVIVTNVNDQYGDSVQGEWKFKKYSTDGCIYYEIDSMPVALRVNGKFAVEKDKYIFCLNIHNSNKEIVDAGSLFLEQDKGHYTKYMLNSDYTEEDFLSLIYNANDTVNLSYKMRDGKTMYFELERE